MDIAICDDDISCRQAVEGLLRKYLTTQDKTCRIVQFTDGESLVTACAEAEPFDLIFLDVFLGSWDGLSAAQALREKGLDSAIVFLSTSRDFAVESYQVSALSYLLKPVTAEQLAAVMDKFLAQYRPAKLQMGECIFAPSELVYAESLDKKILLHFTDKSTQILSGKFEELLTKLSLPNFLHCHRCYIVNLDHVRRIDNGFFLTITDEHVQIRQKELAAVKKAYYHYILSQ